MWPTPPCHARFWRSGQPRASSLRKFWRSGATSGVAPAQTPARSRGSRPGRAHYPNRNFWRSGAPPSPSLANFWRSSAPPRPGVNNFWRSGAAAAPGVRRFWRSGPPDDRLPEPSRCEQRPEEGRDFRWFSQDFAGPRKSATTNAYLVIDFTSGPPNWACQALIAGSTVAGTAPSPAVLPLSAPAPALRTAEAGAPGR
jgi:hypothetical protein